MARYTLVVEVKHNDGRSRPSLVLARPLEACCLPVPREGEEPVTVPCVFHTGRWVILRGLSLFDLLDAVEATRRDSSCPWRPCSCTRARTR